MKIICFDGAAGVSGDMFVGALLDAGADIGFVESSVRSLGIEGLSVKACKIVKGGIAATSFAVQDRGEPAESHASPRHPHRGLTEILEIIESAGIEDELKRHAAAIFARLAEAEAEVHAVSANDIHFHEIGALDSIADVVAACAAVVSIGAEKAYTSPPVLGTGFVRCSHGILPVPAPAVLNLLKNRPVIMDSPSNEAAGELTTPTGAALLAHFCAEFRLPGAFEVLSTGYGAGKKELSFPNVFRATVGLK